MTKPAVMIPPQMLPKTINPSISRGKMPSGLKLSLVSPAWFAPALHGKVNVI